MPPMFTYRIILYFSLVNISYLAFEIGRRGRGNILYALEVLCFGIYPATVLYSGDAGSMEAGLSVVLLVVSLLMPLAVSSSFAKAVFYRKFTVLPRLSTIRAIFVPTFDNISSVQAAFWLRRDIRDGLDGVLSGFGENISRPGTGEAVIRAARQLYSSYFLGMGKYSEAASVYDMTSEISPDIHEVANKVRLFLEAGRHAEALDNLFSLAALSSAAPGTGDPMIYAAIPAAVFAGNPDALERILASAGRAISWLPDESFTAWRHLATALSGNPEEGVRGLTELAAQLSANGKPECAESMLLRASMLSNGEIRLIPENLRRMFIVPIAVWLDERNREAVSEKPAFQKSPAVKILATACVAGFIVSEFLGGTDDTYLLTRMGANVGFLTALGEWHRWVTCAYLHGGPGHLAMNVLFLSVMGPPVEWALGSMAFFFLYTYSAMAGSIANNLAGSTVSVGSSGALMGLLGAAIVIKLTEKRRSSGSDGQLAPLLYTLFAIALVGAAEKVVDNWGHAGGFLGGLAAAWVLVKTHRANRLPDSPVRVTDLPVTRGLGILALAVTLAAFYGAVRSYEYGGYPRLVPGPVLSRTSMGTLALPSNWVPLEGAEDAHTDRLRVVLRVLPMLITGHNRDIFNEYSRQTSDFFYNGKSSGLVLTGRDSFDGTGASGRYSAEAWTFRRPGGQVETAVDFLLLDRTPAAIFHFQVTGATVEPEFRKLFYDICANSTINSPDESHTPFPKSQNEIK